MAPAIIVRLEPSAIPQEWTKPRLPDVDIVTAGAAPRKASMMLPFRTRPIIAIAIMMPFLNGFGLAQTIELS